MFHKMKVWDGNMWPHKKNQLLEERSFFLGWGGEIAKM